MSKPAVGFDITSLSVMDMHKRGVTLAGLATRDAVADDCREWITHSHHDRLYPKLADYHRAMARYLAADYARHHDGEIRGLKLRRSFPCLGVLRVDPSPERRSDDQNPHPRPLVVVCDACGWRTGITQGVFEEALAA